MAKKKICGIYKIENKVNGWHLDNLVKWQHDYNIVKNASKPPSWAGKSHSEKTKKKMKESQRGEKSTTSILKEKDVVNIIKMYSKGGITKKMIAKRFKMSEGQ